MNQPQSLKELVELAIQRHDASGLALSKLAKKAGHQITYTTLNAIRQGTYKYIPREDTLRAIAWLAGVDASVAFTAAGQPVPGPPLAEELPPGSDNLSPKSRKVIIEMARVLVDLEKNADASSTKDQEQPADVGDQGDQLSNPGTGQKNELLADSQHLGGTPAVVADPEVVDHELRHARERRRRGAKHPEADDNGNIPLPEHWQELAAYSSASTRHRERERDWGRLGEETQDSGNDE